MRSNASRHVMGLAAFLAASFWASAGHAFVVSINEFSITRNGAAFFTDTFADGIVPPSAAGTLSYNVLGTIPANAEANGSLLLNSADGALTVNALGQTRTEVRARLLTNIDPTNTSAGLKSDDTMELTGIFSLTTPFGVFNPQYSIRFSDASGGTGLHQLLQLQVRLNAANGTPQIRYLLQDFDAGTIDVLGAESFAPLAGADEILLKISRPDAANNNFFGSFSYLGGGAVLGTTAFATAGIGFQGENFVRAEFNISDGFVPEPTTLSLLAAALAALAFSRRRKA